MQVFILSDLEKPEFVSIAKQTGISERDAELIYLDCGPSLEILLAARDTSDPASYPAKLLGELRGLIEETIRAKPQLREEFRRALGTITTEKPWGDIFTGTEAARLLTQLRLASEYPNGSTRFRNKLAISAVRAAVSQG